MNALLMLLLALPVRAEEPLLLAQADASAFLQGAAGGALVGAGAAVPVVGGSGGVAVEASAAEGDGGGVDLSYQFPDGSRNQADVGSCHAFSSVALLEAAYFRRYGEHLKFSEADLFLRRNVTGRMAYGEYIAWGDPKITEGGNAKWDLDYAIANGIATTPQYEAFLARYREYREAERRTLEDIERQRKRDPWYVRLLYNPRLHWAALQQQPLSKKILENYLLGNDPVVEAERAASRQRLKGFRTVQKLFVELPNSIAKSPDACRKGGRAQTEHLLRELKSGQPVGVSYYTDKKFGGHVIIVQGYQADPVNGVVFKTRNSWGAGGNHDMYPHDMCKMYQAVSVRER